MANVALSSKAVSEVRAALQGISEWFDQYISQEEQNPGEVSWVLIDRGWVLRFQWLRITHFFCNFAGARTQQDYGVAVSSMLGVQTKNRRCFGAYSRKSKDCSMYYCRTTWRWRNLFNRVEAKAKTWAGQNGAMGAWIGLSTVSRCSTSLWFCWSYCVNIIL